MDGIINVLKPPGMTSSDVVVYLRRLLGIKKIGHAGTLDPGAAGVLVVCLGKATRISDYIMKANKTYRGGLVLGTQTDTLDADGHILDENVDFPDLLSIEKAFEVYQGKIMQKPPMYSAIKHRGKRLYELARQGQEVEVAPREIEIFENRILAYIPPKEVFFQVTCTKGTYIRSLARDIGESLGCGAYLSYLVRTSSGDFKIEHSHTLQEIKRGYEDQSMDGILIPMDRALAEFESVLLRDDGFSKAINGNIIKEDLVLSNIGTIEKEQLLRVYCRDQFIGLGYINANDTIRMRKVLV